MGFNSLYVPLDIGTWHCELVPASELYHGWGYRRLWDPFADYEKRQEMERQIEKDARAFDLYFRPDYDFRRLIATDINAIRSCLSDHLNVVHWDLPTDNAGIERLLKQAVRDGRLVPIVNRDAGANQRTYRPAPAPERWPQTGGGGWAPRVEPYGGAYGGLSAVVSAAPTLAGEVASCATDDGGGFDWLGAVQSAAGAMPGDDGDSGVGDGAADLEGDTSSTPLGDAQPFEYSEDAPGADVQELAARGVSEADEGECYAQFERELDECGLYSAMTKDPYTYVACKAQAFANYNQCRGY
ncbi:hypothetical protein AB3X91_19330 [Paraburkholderia sp. BR14263]|uniref:hypothetical protein n=1 Tax=unclassified Paraburkholderia TaxID=2615204 RepID=UPI0034CFB0AA